MTEEKVDGSKSGLQRLARQVLGPPVELPVIPKPIDPCDDMVGENQGHDPCFTANGVCSGSEAHSSVDARLEAMLRGNLRIRQTGPGGED